MNTTSFFLRIGGLLALGSVLCGAFGAHALKDVLSERGTSATWETAVRYQMWHALALILVALLKERQSVCDSTGACFAVGTLLFSGSLYGLALGGPKWLGPITPLGGLCLMAGWGLLVFSTKARDID
jgi:uncharacterized membrane protein YgdD (TMEM256/DUF423 family)